MENHQGLQTMISRCDKGITHTDLAEVAVTLVQLMT